MASIKQELIETTDWLHTSEPYNIMTNDNLYLDPSTMSMNNVKMALESANMRITSLTHTVIQMHRHLKALLKIQDLMNID